MEFSNYRENNNDRYLFYHDEFYCSLFVDICVIIQSFGVIFVDIYVLLKSIGVPFVDICVVMKSFYVCYFC